LAAQVTHAEMLVAPVVVDRVLIGHVVQEVLPELPV